MKTKQKCAIHLKQGDVVVVTPEVRSSAVQEWTVSKVTPHEEMPDWISVEFSYVQQVPDGNGGTKNTTKTTRGIIYTERENVKVKVVEAKPSKKAKKAKAAEVAA